MLSQKGAMFQQIGAGDRAGVTTLCMQPGGKQPGG